MFALLEIARIYKALKLLGLDLYIDLYVIHAIC